MRNRHPGSAHRSPVEPRRRDVLAAAAGVAVWASAPPLAGLGAELPATALAVGYCGGATVEPADNWPAGGARALAAGRLAGGDPHLARDARILIHGLVGAAEKGWLAGVRSVDLGISFPLADTHPAEGEVRVWRYETTPITQVSPPTRLTVPTDDGLALSLVVEGQESRRYETRLVIGRWPGVPKLRTGLYLVAPDALALPSDRPARRGPAIAFSVEPVGGTTPS